MRLVGLVVALALNLALAPLAGEAQQAGKVYQVGILAVGPWAAIEGLRDGLKDLGYQEGQRVRFEYRWAGTDERLPVAAAELVQLNVDVIVTWGTPAALAAKLATSTIPIIGILGDPIVIGLTSSLSRPGGNITGFMSVAQELKAKRLELLREVVPSVARVAVIWNPRNVALKPSLEHLRAAASRFRIKIDFAEAHDTGGLHLAFDAIKVSQPGALLIVADPLLITERERIAAFAMARRLPSISAYRQYPEVGGLMSYGPSYSDLFRRAASYVDRIARGEKPGDLPFQQPTKFELVINLKTAKALGLTIPQTVILQADEVIQ
jgi:putative tryptophan/tyrosine transport system substrate-binding protein